MNTNYTSTAPEPLNILTANWTWHLAGGDWTYVDNVSKIYQKRGHQVIPFSMKSHRNLDSKYDSYFVEHIDYKELNRKKSVSNGLKAVSKSVYSFEAKKNLTRLLKQVRIDIAHLHNIHHYITPAILPLLKEHNIPVLWTLHDYTILCPENSFVSNGRICEKCRGGAFYHCAIQRCKKQSFLASFLGAAENYLHRYMKLFSLVDYFLCPSEFLFNKFIEFGFFPEKMVLLHNCFNFSAEIDKKTPEDYLLFAGRLHATKGIMTLLKAFEGLQTNAKLYIAGEGPERENIESYIASSKMRNVVLLGYRSNDDILNLMAGAKMLICPSEWYENFPSVIIEAISVKTPVIANSIGGIPELIVHEHTGLLAEPFDSPSLKMQMNRLLSDGDFAVRLAEQAFERTRSLVSYEQHHSTLKEVFATLGLVL